MAQTTAIARTTVGDVQAKLARINQYYDIMKAGQHFSTDQIMTIPTLKEIERDLLRMKPSARKAYNLSDYRPRDVMLCDYVAKMLLSELAASPLEDRSESYSLLVTTLDRFGRLNERYLKALCDQLGDENLTASLCDSADEYLKERLAHRYEEAALYPADADMLLQGAGSPNDRLNALLRPLPDKLVMHWLSAVECSYGAAGRDMYEEDDFVDRIIPYNAFANDFHEAVDPQKIKADELRRQEISAALLDAMRATTVQQRARLYEQTLIALTRYDTTPEKFMATYPDEASRANIKTCFQTCAVAYVKMGLIDMLQAHPLSQDEIELIADISANPGEQINTLFRNSGDMGNILLGQLEAAMFDLEDPRLAGRILFAADGQLGVQPEPLLLGMTKQP